jgi:UDP-3-O-[3-hydroxymyristoyl] glucosamine N-acyltransferase
MIERKEYLIGCGDLFDSLADDLSGYWNNSRNVNLIQINDVSSIASEADALLSNLNPEQVSLFVAVDSNALNYARLELYGRARLRGFRLTNLVHKTAVLSPSVSLADNVCIGPMVLLSNAVKIGSDSMVGARTRIDSHASVGPHSWVGAGSAIGAMARVGSHCVLGANTVLLDHANIGSNTILDQVGPWQGTVAPGTFAERGYSSAARIIGKSYSFEKKKSL